MPGLIWSISFWWWRHLSRPPGVFQGQEESRDQSLLQRGAGLHSKTSVEGHDHIRRAKEIAGNKKKLTWWQDELWKHIVKKYSDQERGESGHTHIPPRLFKDAVQLNLIEDRILAILNDSNPFNKKAKPEEPEALTDKYIPGV